MNADTKFLRLSQLRRLRETEQVAAVCYRMRGEDIEFLLVQTGGGRWIFPKGCVEPGLTHAQAAAIEAFEEAGAHGRIEEESFGQYRVRRPGKRNTAKQTVTAHLCEVLRLSPPQESGRNRTWYSVEKTKLRLHKDRPADEGRELARVVTRAVMRIAQAREKTTLAVATPAVNHQTQKDSLQKVQFEAPVAGHARGQIDALYMRHIRRLRGDVKHWADSDIAGFTKPLPRLNSANVTAAAIQKVTAIDQVRSDRGKARS
jgi:8-oxo-dGTP pyrophosphatase MutT (NUDIX family)